MKGLLSKAAGFVTSKLDASPAAVSPVARNIPAGEGQPANPDPVLEHLLRNVRSKRVRRHFFTHAASEYTDARDVTVLAGTYNVAGKKPPPGLTLNPWLDQWKSSWPSTTDGAQGGGRGGPDVVAIGFQEVVPLSAGNVIAGPSSDGADAWDFVLASSLNGEAWASRNFGRTYGSPLAGSGAAFTGIERFGSQAAYAYAVISSQASSVLVGAMDRMWVGDSDAGARSTSPAGSVGGAMSAAADAEQSARVQLAVEDGSDGDEVYVQVSAKQLVGVYLSVWVRKRLARHVRGVQSTSLATGWGGYLANKGAVAVRMRVYDTPLCIVAAHLASGDAEGDELKRNADAAEILRRCCFSTDAELAAAGVRSLGPPGHWGELRSIDDHDNCVLLGDLNYRLCLADDEVRRLLRTGKLERLLEFDQLGREMAAGRVLQGWREGPIMFAPTYKYHVGANVYNGDPATASAAAAADAADDTFFSPLTSSVAGAGAAPDAASDASAHGAGGGGGGGAESAADRAEKAKKRTPAWCDRVLWLPGRRLHQLAYGRGELTVSDHRPVAGAFLLQAAWYKREVVEALLEGARRLVDASDMAHRPRCSLEPKFVDVGLLPFGTPHRNVLRLENTGGVEASFYFVPPPRPQGGREGGRVTWDDNQPVCPPWLSIQPLEGVIPPGASVDIALTTLVAGGSGGGAAALMHGVASGASSPMDAILILRIEDGSDAFVSVQGTFLRSCFGMDLDVLASLGAETPLPPAAQLPPAAAAAMQQALCGGQSEAAGGGGGRRSSGGGAGSSAPPAAGTGADGSSSGGGPNVPKEVQLLVSFLQAGMRLLTPGLFVHSCEAVVGAPRRAQQPTAPLQVQQLLVATAALRWALDTGEALPPGCTAHEAAAALLLLFQQLPDSFMPPAVSAVCARCVPSYPAATALLADSMSPVEWATLRHVLALLRAALAPDAAASNGLTAAALATALANFLFGCPNTAAPPEIAANRVAFLMVLLDPDSSDTAAAQQQQQQQLQ